MQTVSEGDTERERVVRGRGEGVEMGSWGGWGGDEMTEERLGERRQRRREREIESF